MKNQSIEIIIPKIARISGLSPTHDILDVNLDESPLKLEQLRDCFRRVADGIDGYLLAAEQSF